MKLLFNTKAINMPPMLWKFHGRRTYLIDLVLTYTLAVIVMLFNLFFSAPLPAWKIMVIAMLSLDIGGGVVSNFTSGTINFYRSSKLSPHAFVWSHIFQSGALILVYLDFSLQIGLISFLAMIFSSITLSLHNTSFQRQASVFLFALLMLVLRLYDELPVPSYLLLLLLSLKLMAGFSGHWKKDIEYK